MKLRIMIHKKTEFGTKTENHVYPTQYNFHLVWVYRNDFVFTSFLPTFPIIVPPQPPPHNMYTRMRLNVVSKQSTYASTLCICITNHTNIELHSVRRYDGRGKSSTARLTHFLTYTQRFEFSPVQREQAMVGYRVICMLSVVGTAVLTTLSVLHGGRTEAVSVRHT